MKRWFASVWDLWRRARSQSSGSNAAPEPKASHLIAPAGSVILCPDCDDLIGFLRVDVYAGMVMRASQVWFTERQHCEPGDPARCKKCDAAWMRSFVNSALELA